MKESVRNGNSDASKAEYDGSGNKLQTLSIIVSGWPAVGKTTVAASQLMNLD